MQIIAVNENGAESMKTAFQTYYDGVLEVLDNIKNRDIETYETGFKGAQTQKIHDYVGEIIDVMHEISDPLEEFKTAIENVIRNYTAQAAAYQNKEVKVDAIGGAGDLTGVASFSEGEGGTGGPGSGR